MDDLLRIVEAYLVICFLCGLVSLFCLILLGMIYKISAASSALSLHTY